MNDVTSLIVTQYTPAFREATPLSQMNTRLAEPKSNMSERSDLAGIVQRNHCHGADQASICFGSVTSDVDRQARRSVAT